jgi:hypothetical protein
MRRVVAVAIPNVILLDEPAHPLAREVGTTPCGVPTSVQG